MQRTITNARWVMLAAFAAVCALVLSLVIAQPARANDDLTVPEVDLTVQSGDATTWPLKVYLQHGSETPTLVKSYTKSEFADLAIGGDLVSGLSWDGSVWSVTTAVKYVAFETLLSDAEIAWASGATVTFENTVTSESQSFTYEDIADMLFYPNTMRESRDYNGAEKTGLVFGLENAKNVAIGDSAKASDVQAAAASTSKSDESVLAVMGSLKSDVDKLSGTTVSLGRFIEGVDKITITYSTDKNMMFRLYNPNSGEHFYTASAAERDAVKAAGWDYEGEAWTAPKVSNTPVYRVYNPNAGDHHYTTSAYERDFLVKVGWKDEGIGWYSDDAKGVNVYRAYNPNAVAGAHHYTTDAAERDYLVSVGWNDEGIGWYGLA